ncbi:MAG: acyl-CoA-binding protein [Pseudomonadota bacterium]
MSDLQALFEDASVRIKTLGERPDNDTMLQLYALFKQGSEGDISGEKPGFFDFVGVAKFEAWEKLKGQDQASAQQAYVDLVNSLTSD